jgi:hypothetical protein
MPTLHLNLESFFWTLEQRNIWVHRSMLQKRKTYVNISLISLTLHRTPDAHFHLRQWASCDDDFISSLWHVPLSKLREPLKWVVLWVEDTHNYLLVVSPFHSVGGNLTPTPVTWGFWFRVPSFVAFVYLALRPHRGRRDYRVHDNAEFHLVPSFECCELTVTLVFEFHFFRNFMNHFLFWPVANLNLS